MSRRTQVGKLEVLHHDNVLRYRVRSRTRADTEHVVDVSANAGIGACSCEHFTMRLQPAIDAGAASKGVAVRCSHIAAAREACLNELIQRITSGLDDDQAPTEPTPAIREWRCPTCGWKAQSMTAPGARNAINKHPDHDTDCPHLGIEEIKP